MTIHTTRRLSRQRSHYSVRRPVRRSAALATLCSSLLLSAGLWCATAGELTTSTDADHGVVSVSAGQRVLLRYQATPAPYKVYVKEWFSPAGVQVLRDSPHDHVHHHALMYAIGADGVDFWVESPKSKPGSQVPRGEPSVNVSKGDGGQRAQIGQTIDWTDVDGNRVLAEERKIVVREDAIPGASLLEWTSHFSPAEGRDKAELWGRHYFGLGMRFVIPMDSGGTVLNATGESGVHVRGTEYVVPADWCAYTAAVDGKPVTVAMFGHPNSARHPTHWFTMTRPFAYLSATLNLGKEPLTIAGDKPLRLTYAAVLWDGKVGRERIRQAYDSWKAVH